ncbi:nucleotidyltransferase [Adhaeribacter swui]|uniref:Nucleotidyltransferase n=1 Tax=Adhaeribacter swui TaxID=2086471 RepID=A0A7G7G6S7_9BACT|nr:sugar phosphate nucleotidyltransferase [Adhaeribacter swui]QNF32861.1 nucleotidyltransferase [Adhaeribacter swui]
MSRNASPTLVVMAAGMATRYGSLKQIDAFGPNGETIIEYSVYDAIRAGFKKIIFIIRQSVEEEFRRVMQNKFPDEIEIDYVLQELDNLPDGFTVPENRVKPWGTGHALWVAGQKIKEPFAIINGDDFYGSTSYAQITQFFQQENAPAGCLVGYQLVNTLSDNGAVSRGVCERDENGFLKSITEQTHIQDTPEGIVAQTANGEILKLSGCEIVSMNLMAFQPEVLAYFEEYLIQFLEKEAHQPKAEFFLPTVINNLVQENKIKVQVIESGEKWFGVTYPADKPVAVQNLKKRIDKGIYPENLWNNTLETADLA